jgi:cell wall-associated NlpC family hydrolase
LTASSAGPPIRSIRSLARPASVLALALGLGCGPWAAAASAAGNTGTAVASAGTGTGSGASGGTGSSSVSALQVRAQELAGEIDADGRTLDQLDASYESAQIGYQRLTGQAAAMRKDLTATAAEVATARSGLKQQALLAYLAGGAPVVTQIPDRPGVDRSLTIAYAEIVAGGQKTALENYRATLDTQTRQRAALDADTRQMGVTLQAIKTDTEQAAATMASRQRTLAQVKGQLAAAVTNVQAQQQASEQAQERAILTAQGVQLPTTAANLQSDSSPGASPGPPTRIVPVTPGAPPRTTARAAPVPTNSVRPISPAPTTPAPSGSGSPSGGGSAGAPPPQAAGGGRALAYARAQIGKPYQWGGAGPNSFDCSGLVMMAWAEAGISFPHLAQDQYNLTSREPLADLEPGDLVFYGTPNNVYHVGIYIGGGNMIDAPETGETVHVQSIYWDTLLGAGRVTASS